MSYNLFFNKINALSKETESLHWIHEALSSRHSRTVIEVLTCVIRVLIVFF